MSTDQTRFHQDSEQLEGQYEEFRDTFNRIQREISKLIVGQQEIIEGVLICLMTGGHALLEGVPGLGKTLLIRTLHEVPRSGVLPNTVYARSDARGHHRHQRCRRRRKWP